MTGRRDNNQGRLKRLALLLAILVAAGTSAHGLLSRRGPGGCGGHEQYGPPRSPDSVSVHGEPHGAPAQDVSFQGEVVDHHGEPLSSVNLVLHDTGDGLPWAAIHGGLAELLASTAQTEIGGDGHDGAFAPSQATVSNSQGRFSFHGFLPEQFVIVSRAPGYATTATTITSPAIDNEPVTETTIVMEPGARIEGRVVTGEEGVAGARVVAMDRRAGVLPPQKAVTVEDGRFTLDGLSPHGSYLLAASAKGLIMRRPATGRPDAGAVRIHMSPGITLWGIVTVDGAHWGEDTKATSGPDGPVQGAEVLLAGTGLWPPRVARTDEQGRYRFEGLPRGVYSVWSRHSAEGLASAINDQIMVSEGDIERADREGAGSEEDLNGERRIDLAMLPRPPLRGVVSKGQSSTRAHRRGGVSEICALPSEGRLEGAKVIATPRHPSMQALRASSREDGSFNLGPVPDGTDSWRISVQGEGHLSMNAVPIDLPGAGGAPPSESTPDQGGEEGSIVVCRGEDGLPLVVVRLHQGLTLEGVVVDREGKPAPFTRLAVEVYPGGEGLIPVRLDGTATPTNRPIWTILTGEPDPGASLGRRYLTDERGHFSISGIPTGPMVLHAWNRLQGQAQLPLGDQDSHQRKSRSDLRLVLRSDGGGFHQFSSGTARDLTDGDDEEEAPWDGLLEGYVLDIHESPLARAEVHLLDQQGGRTRLSASTDAEGLFRLSGLPDRAEWTLKVEAEGHQKERARVINTGRVPILRLAPLSVLGGLGGQVVGPDDRPVAGARVEISVEGQDAVGGEGPRSAITDGDGRFLVEGLGEGTATIRVEAGDEDLRQVTPLREPVGAGETWDDLLIILDYR